MVVFLCVSLIPHLKYSYLNAKTETIVETMRDINVMFGWKKVSKLRRRRRKEERRKAKKGKKKRKDKAKSI